MIDVELLVVLSPPAASDDGYVGEEIVDVLLDNGDGVGQAEYRRQLFLFFLLPDLVFDLLDQVGLLFQRRLVGQGRTSAGMDVVANQMAATTTAATAAASVICRQGDVEQGWVLFHDGELDLARAVALGKHFHGVDTRQQDTPELSLFRRLEPNVASLDLVKQRLLLQLLSVSNHFETVFG